MLKKAEGDVRVGTIMDEKKISVSGATIRYLEGGAGDPILFLPSASGRATEYREVISLLADAFHVYAVDYPGFGQSDPLRQMTGIDDLSNFVRRWREALGLSRCHLCGFSLGGWISLAMALSDPESILKLILIATSAGKLPHIPIVNPSGMTYREILNQFYYLPEVRESLSRRKLSAEEKEEILRSSRALASLVRQGEVIPDFHDRLHEIRHPTLIVGARQDRAVPLIYQQQLHAGISGSKLIVFEETGHAIVTERPERLADAIAEFIAGTAPPA